VLIGRLCLRAVLCWTSSQEDSDISNWAHAHFKSLISGVSVPSVSGKITGFERISGDCTIIFSRGKRRHGYDISALANFTAKVTAEGKEIKGTLEFPEIADSVADEPWQVLVSIKDPTADTKVQGEQVYDEFKKAVPHFRKAIDAWVADLKKHEG
jgi:activator of HSP90 ATPase